MADEAASLFDPNQIQNEAEHAPEAGFSPMRFGRVTLTPKVLRWETDGGVRIPKRTALAPGQQLKQGETIELEFSVDIKEFQPNLNFEYVRSVTMRKSRRSGDKITEPTDWSEIVEPSLLKCFGKEWAAKLLTRPYVMVEEVPNVAGRTSAKSGKMFGVVKFIRMFKSRDDCYAAFHELVPAAEQGAVSANGSSAFPDTVLHDVAELIASNGIDQVRVILDSKPFGDYDGGKLIEAAQALASA